MEVWDWADDNVSINDSASGFDPDNCPGNVWLGDAPGELLDATFDVPGLADAMTAVGWIVIRSGSLVFPNFGRHNGKSAKSRTLDSARKKAARVSHPEVVRKMSGSQPDKKRTRGEERREEKKKEETPPNPPAGGTAPKPEEPPKPSAKVRKRDELFDAIAEVTGTSPATKGSHIGKIASALRSAEPPYSPEEVREFGIRFHEICTWARDDNRAWPTLGELESHIAKVRQPRPLMNTQQPRARYPTKAEKQNEEFIRMGMACMGSMANQDKEVEPTPLPQLPGAK